MKTAFDLQGFNLTAWKQDGWNSTQPIEEALSYALEEGANFLVFDYAVNFNDDGTIVTNGGVSHPAWEDITSVVHRAKELGFYVMMKPHVSMTSSPINRNIWNTNISTFLPSSFFKDYKGYLSEVAQFCTANSVDSLCIGTELNHIDYLFPDEWTDLILTVRQKFNGPLTYDAIFSLSKSVKDIEDVIFWDKLDFIGCSLYVPLTKDDNASVDVLKGLWYNNDTGDIKDVVSYLKSISDKYSKQLIALEGGYQSVNGALYDVNSSPADTKVINNDVQARGLDAYLSVLSESKGAWLKGVSLWQITPSQMTPFALQSIYHTQEFRTYKKPAAVVIKEHFRP